MSSRKVPVEFIPKHINTAGTGTGTGSSLSKWVPLICAGAAVSVSILALKEIKNVRKEMLTMKKEQGGSGDVIKKMELMDEQLKKITEFLQKKQKVVKSAVADNQDSEIRIVNDSVTEIEYEEVEVTDDEEETE